MVYLKVCKITRFNGKKYCFELNFNPMITNTNIKKYHRRWRQHRAITVDTVDIVDTVDTVETVDTVDTVDTVRHCSTLLT